MSRRSYLFKSSLALTCASIAISANAQELPANVSDEADTIVVTGSRIVRADLEASSPVSVVGGEEIALRQPNSAEDLLRTLPAVRPNYGSAVNNGGDGSATVDLRGIGTNRTLVMMDGRRIVPFGLDGVVDLNVIPVGLVERVEVLTGGASSVYGADAVAGVVNFITKRDFSGLDLSGNYRIAERGDAAQYKADALFGANIADDRGNVVLGLGYSNRRPLFHSDRSVSETAISSQNGLFQGSTVAVPAIFQSGLRSATNPNGLPTGGFGAVIDPATGAFRAATQADTFDTAIGSYLITPLERFNIYSAARYDITDGVEAYASGLFARNKAELQTPPGGTFFNTYQMPLSNPYLPVAARNQLCAANNIGAAACAAAAAATTPGSAGYREIPVIPSRRFQEYGPRGQPITSNVFQVQAGLRGNITDTLRYDLSGQYGETDQTQQFINWGSSTKVQQALRAYRNTAGTPVCIDTTNGCTPLNVFGANGSITPAQIAFIDLDAQIKRLVTQSVITGSVSGDLFNITSPFATKPIAFSIGAERRELTAKGMPDASVQVTGEVLGNGPTLPYSGKIVAKELFGEIIVPLLEDSLLYKVSVDAGIRLSDYSTTGKSTTWKAGGTIEPARGFKLRGEYQRAVRSPNIQELFQPALASLSNLTVDPCQGATPTASRALCEGTGAPAGTYGGIPAPTAGQINVQTAGNPNLDVERASTYTLGAVIAPPRLRDFSLTIDYFNISITDLISAPTQNDILNGCYSTTLNPSGTLNAFCQLIRRNPLTGSLNGGADTRGVILASSNLGRLKTAGIDLGIAYRVPLDGVFGATDSSLKLSANGTWLDYYTIQATPISINRECTGYYSTSCTNPRPEWKWNARMVYANGPFDVSLNWNHISSVELEGIRPTDAALTDAAPGNTATAYNAIFADFRKIKAYDYFDLTLRARIQEHVEMSLLVENLFDKAPPLVGNGVGGAAFNNGNTFPTTYDAIGRAATISLHFTY